MEALAGRQLLQLCGTLDVGPAAAGGAAAEELALMREACQVGVGVNLRRGGSYASSRAKRAVVD